jgi:hypothetical protein
MEVIKIWPSVEPSLGRNQVSGSSQLLQLRIAQRFVGRGPYMAAHGVALFGTKRWFVIWLWTLYGDAWCSSIWYQTI